MDMVHAKSGMMRTVCFILLVCVCLVHAERQTWVVQLKRHTQLDIDAFAMQHNLEYVNDMPHLPGYYLFRTTAHTNPEQFNMHMAHDKHSNVHWLEQQVDRKRFKRSQDPQWSSQWHLKGEPAGVHAEDAWNAPYSKRGSSAITIAIVDDGLESTHPDLRDRFNARDSWDYNHNKPTVIPYHNDGHGTSAAGVCCATANNHQCGSGVCPECSVAGIRLIAGPVNDYTESVALAHHDLPIYSCSWVSHAL